MLGSRFNLNSISVYLLSLEPALFQSCMTYVCNILLCSVLFELRFHLQEKSTTKVEKESPKKYAGVDESKAANDSYAGSTDIDDGEWRVEVVVKLHVLFTIRDTQFIVIDTSMYYDDWFR